MPLPLPALRSAAGVLNIDKVTNADLLGADASPEKILQGQVPQPVEFAELYNLLNKLSAAPPA